MIISSEILLSLQKRNALTALLPQISNAMLIVKNWPIKTIVMIAGRKIAIVVMEPQLET